MKAAFIFILIALISACGGSEKETEYVGYPPGGSGNPPAPRPGLPADYGQISQILNQSCGGASCHAGASFLSSEAALRSSAQVRNRIANGSMPPPYASNYNLWEDGTRKAKVLEFLNR